jgi:alpha-L-rhamnosidase
VGKNIDDPCRLRLTFGEVPPDVTEELDDCKSWIATSWLPDEVTNVDRLPMNVKYYGGILFATFGYK